MDRPLYSLMPPLGLMLGGCMHEPIKWAPQPANDRHPLKARALCLTPGRDLPGAHGNSLRGEVAWQEGDHFEPQVLMPPCLLKASAGYAKREQLL